MTKPHFMTEEELAESLILLKVTGKVVGATIDPTADGVATELESDDPRVRKFGVTVDEQHFVVTIAEE